MNHFAASFTRGESDTQIPIRKFFCNSPLFSEIPLSQCDSIASLISNVISINERPQRSLLRAQDISHLNDSDSFLALANSGCFRSAAYYAATRIGENPQNVRELCRLWYFRLYCLIQLKLFDQAGYEAVCILLF